ncbi:hypothetical protein HYDPIDRAFT_118790 [Hydnomerulius pinastri MD-312]|uniref:Unplaced genomic scaffold scaffold_60, whole genome shotgun sequence n=1 Tax=Hydnomerulius pinastri MD-312 TaxID=994086 RepID=A0A0C9V1W5_9AGAM|nr:hypothetical protein HYDPIDRAFT_118790 [Hydnomerulius pinastri MD-312]
MASWDPVAFKTLLRTTSQRLGQLQERKDSQGQITRRDIATLLSQGNLGLARAKAANLIQEDGDGDLLEELEMLVGVIGGCVGELEGVGSGKTLSPVLVEAAATIIHVAPSTESKDLNTVREILTQRLGPAFAQVASRSRNKHVSPRVMQILATPPPSASKMDDCLLNIANTYGVKWTPEPRRQDILNSISEILDTDPGSAPIVDLPRLRKLCSQGLPDDPPWIRPRIWRLLFGTLPVLKTTWEKENQKQRDSYYDLVRRVLDPLTSLPPPTTPLSPTDTTISAISESLFRLPPDLFSMLEGEPGSASPRISPLDLSAPDDVRIDCALNLDKRLELIRAENDDGSPTGIPEIRLEPEAHSPPASSSTSTFTVPSTPDPSSLSARRPNAPTTLLHSRPYSTPPAHHTHLTALHRLLYLHSALNPANQSPHIPSLLVPLYSALVGEVERAEVAHAEADTFWLFEALVGEVGEMEEQEGGKVWMKRFSERVGWADGELADSLHSKSLDPILPHYSYRWLAPLLTQTLPLSSVFPVWDVIFACPMRTRDSNPKLEYLVDICTALLIRARTPLFRLGKPGRKSPGLWAQEHAALPPLSPLRPWELSDAFMEGMALLTTYPIDAAGGIDRVLQTALDLAQKRIEEKDREKERERERVNGGFGARIRERVWKGFTNQVADGEEEEEGEEETEEEEEETEEESGEEHDDGNETETPAAPTLTSRLANTVWRGITNQSSMEDEMPSPPSPSSPSRSRSPSPPPPKDPYAEKPLPVPSTPPPTQQTSIWGYAGKLKDSDTVATFAKVGTNWRAKAMDAWSVRRGSNASAPGPSPDSRGNSHSVSGIPSPSSVASDLPPQKSGWPSLGGFSDTPSPRRGSLPGLPDRENAMNPPRPAFFRSPRESFLPQPRRQNSTAPPSPHLSAVDRYDSEDDQSSSSFVHKAKASLASFAAFQAQSSPPVPPAKSGPRPLMLNSRELMTSKPQSSARSDGGTPLQRQGQWSDVLLAKGHVLRQESISSTTSLPPSDALSRPYQHPRSAGTGPRSDYDSDGGSRRIPLNRKSISPMAVVSRSPRLPWAASPSSGHSSDNGMTSLRGHPLSNGSIAEETTSEHGWRNFESTALDSPTTISSPPIPPTPITSTTPSEGVRVVNNGHMGSGSISMISEEGGPLEAPAQSRLLIRKKTPPPASADVEGTDTSEDSTSVSRTPSSATKTTPSRIRSKRYVARPANLRIRDNSLRANANTVVEQRAPSPNTLAPEWPEEQELATTPRVGDFGPSSEPESASESPTLSRRLPARKTSGDTDRPRKALVDGGVRARKVSTGSREVRRTRDSGAEEGDDEGYDDLLSAYESEEGSRE